MQGLMIINSFTCNSASVYSGTLL